MKIQAHQVLRINDSTLVIGIDIAKHGHVAVWQEPDGRRSKPLSFSNTREGFTRFQQWQRDAQVRSRTTAVVIGLEPTGQYWLPLAAWLRDEGETIHLVPPLFTKRAKELVDGSPLKSDAKDAWVIADLVRQGKGRPWVVQAEPFHELRYLVALRRRLVKARVATLNQMHRVLDGLFPELPGLFSELDGATAQALLHAAPTPAEVLALGEAALARLLARHGRQQRWGREKARVVLDAARQSIACPYGRPTLRLEMALLLPRLATLDQDLARVEHAMQDAVHCVDYAPLLLSIPRLGKVTAAIILGELGDLRQYRHPRQVLKMAGLNLFERSSGQVHGQQRISKRGRAQLRWVLYLAALRMADEGRPLHGLFEKCRPQRPGAQIAVIGMRRLLKTLFALVRDGQPFDAARFEVQPAMAPARTPATS